MSAQNRFEQIISAGWAGVLQWKTDGESESSDLDFKVSDWQGNKLGDEDKKSLGKGVSGLANTDGGVLVFGVKTRKSLEVDRVDEIQQIRSLRLYIDKLNEYLRTCTEPTVAGTKAEGIFSPDAEDVGVAVVLIPASDAGPHRAKSAGDKWSDRYFMRAGTSTVVIPHNTLRDAFGRTARSHLHLNVEWAGISMAGACLRLRITNDGGGTARQPAVQIGARNLSIQTMTWEVAKPFNTARWQRLESKLEGEFAFLIQALPEVIVYPGLNFEVAYGNVPEQYRQHAWFEFYGRLYAIDSQPVPFSFRVDPTKACVLQVP